MGSLKLEQRQKVESDQERGREVQESGEQKLEEAEASQGAMEQIEAIDYDDKAALDAARASSSRHFRETGGSAAGCLPKYRFREAGRKTVWAF